MPNEPLSLFQLTPIEFVATTLKRIVRGTKTQSYRQTGKVKNIAETVLQVPNIAWLKSLSSIPVDQY